MSSCQYCTRKFTPKGKRVYCSDNCYRGAKSMVERIHRQEKLYKKLMLGVPCPTCGEKVYQGKVIKYCSKCKERTMKEKAKKKYLLAKTDKVKAKEYNAEMYQKRKARNGGGKPKKTINPYFLSRGTPSGLQNSGFIPSS